jgi:hypothetical protein
VKYYVTKQHTIIRECKEWFDKTKLDKVQDEKSNCKITLNLMNHKSSKPKSFLCFHRNLFSRLLLKSAN